MLITHHILAFLPFNSSREFVFLSVINNCRYFGSKKCYLFQAGSLHQKVLYQRTFTWNNIFYRTGPAVFYFHAAGRIFFMAAAGWAYCFVLAVHSGRGFPVVQVYPVSGIQTVQTTEGN